MRQRRCFGVNIKLIDVNRVAKTVRKCRTQSTMCGQTYENFIALSFSLSLSKGIVFQKWITKKEKGGRKERGPPPSVCSPQTRFPFLSFLREKKEKKRSNYLSRPNGAILISPLKWDLGEKGKTLIFTLSLSRSI